ncbi:MAG: hypothetical protein HW380_2545 [Magnetococcales bacterium]|nr:hypothetical protein [Magnetococcales bacterium]HIJ83538.1 helix-turn-helix domain-containing protein [Magnetococcales bacterium]
MSEFCDRLREERDKLELNQREFGRIGGVTLDAQSRYERGQRSPNSKYLEAIAAAGADVAYIITGVRAGTPGVPPLSREEECLLDNYRHSPESEQAILRATSAAFAQANLVKKSGKKAG